MELFFNTSFEISKLITKKYSTSFFWASNFFSKEIKQNIFNIYGFVRLADEIVDTFHKYNKKELFENFEQELEYALINKISLNPILNSFQYTVNKFNIRKEYIVAFMDSMEKDLEKRSYKTKTEINEYIYGSADVVGLMCLQVFCNNNQEKFDELKSSALKLGSAFQKVNFLRDLKNDTEDLGRIYFPQIINEELNSETKKEIALDIQNDFNIAHKGIKKLPKSSKTAVYIAYLYYTKLLNKIEKKTAQKILDERIRISNFRKLMIIFRAFFVTKLNII